MQIGEILPEYERQIPKIYVYSDSSFPGWLKIGLTTRDDVNERIDEQHPIAEPYKTYKTEWYGDAFYDDGSGETFTDKTIHRYLKEHHKDVRSEWCRCTLKEVIAAYNAVKEKCELGLGRNLNFKMRPEQEMAVEQTLAYFKKIDSEGGKYKPHFLWNAKMRFGKTFTTYQLAKRMGAKRVLVLTFKPAVEEAWKEDLMCHVDFVGWQFYSSRSGKSIDEYDKSKPLVCFGSFQDYLGVNKMGGIKEKNEWVHHTEWDLIVLDEYHYGAWNENSKRLLSEEEQEEQDERDEILKTEGSDVKGHNAWDDTNLPIQGKHFLYLSGTPFRALASGEFMEDQIFNWTYHDEQRAKRDFVGENNPYEELPMMVMMTYQMPKDLGGMIEQYDMNEFDLNEFFRAEDKGKGARFVHEEAVQKWLDIIRGKTSIFNSDDPGLDKPALPYQDSRLLEMCTHTMWFMNSVASCDAMEEMLSRRTNAFYHDYKVVNCSGTAAGIGLDALIPVKEAMKVNPIETKTIILTCGKLTTGVTIRPLSGIFMLRNCSSPETYFQAAFRVQSPWTVMKEGEKEKEILKKTCYVFDFAPNRALREVVNYAQKLSVDGNERITDKVKDFINFLPILQFDGSVMKELNATEILEFVDNGISGTLLARRWNSALLVNVDNMTLNRVLHNEKALAAIMKIEGFRKMGEDVIEQIVNKAEKIKQLKHVDDNDSKQKEKKKELSEEEKEYRSKRREVQEKLMKFATRIPIFMYLTDYREESLSDVIKKLEPALFEKVTGLDVEDFDLLLRVGVFNQSQMNDAILKFRRYEDASLAYTGVNKHGESDYVGMFDSKVIIKAKVKE